MDPSEWRDMMVFVMESNPNPAHQNLDFEKANEIYFRLGIIYKHQRKYQQSLEVGFGAATTLTHSASGSS